MEAVSSAAPAPSLDSSFTPLSSHQERTPSTFFGGKPVLHHHCGSLDVLLSRAAVRSHPSLFAGFSPSFSPSGSGDDGGGGGGDNRHDRTASLIRVPSARLFVASDAVSLALDPAGATCLRIPYPAITLHATQRLRRAPGSASGYASDPSPPAADSGGDSGGRPEESAARVSALYLQVDPHAHLRGHRDFGDGDDDGGTDAPLDLLLVPTAAAAGSERDGTGSSDDDGDEDEVKAIFEALSRCADLHPDPDMDDEDDDEYGGGSGMMMAAMMSASSLGQGDGHGGGWITAENMHEFEDRFGGADGGDGGEGEDVEEGQDGRAGAATAAAQQERLGPGAGTVRARRDDQHDEGGGGPNGVAETKWQRTG